jgi:hypothetical protein
MFNLPGLSNVLRVSPAAGDDELLKGANIC